MMNTRPDESVDRSGPRGAFPGATRARFGHFLGTLLLGSAAVEQRGDNMKRFENFLGTQVLKTVETTLVRRRTRSNLGEC